MTCVRAVPHLPSAGCLWVGRTAGYGSTERLGDIRHSVMGKRRLACQRPRGHDAPWPPILRGAPRPSPAASRPPTGAHAVDPLARPRFFLLAPIRLCFPLLCCGLPITPVYGGPRRQFALVCPLFRLYSAAQGRHHACVTAAQAPSAKWAGRATPSSAPHPPAPLTQPTVRRPRGVTRRCQERSTHAAAAKRTRTAGQHRIELSCGLSARYLTASILLRTTPWSRTRCTYNHCYPHVIQDCQTCPTVRFGADVGPSSARVVSAAATGPHDRRDRADCFTTPQRENHRWELIATSRPPRAGAAPPGRGRVVAAAGW